MVKTVLLPRLSKVFEGLALNQLIVYINEEALLDSRFRKGHSTTTVLLGIRDPLIRALSRGRGGNTDGLLRL